MVEMKGVEPSTSPMRTARSSQLSYIPKLSPQSKARTYEVKLGLEAVGMVGDTGLEPVTFRTSSERSSQLS